MKTITRPLTVVMLVLSLCFGSVAITGCGTSSSASASASAASASAANEKSASSDAQDDCYGDDLPATKSDKSQ